MDCALPICSAQASPHLTSGTLRGKKINPYIGFRTLITIGRNAVGPLLDFWRGKTKGIGSSGRPFRILYSEDPGALVSGGIAARDAILRSSRPSLTGGLERATAVVWWRARMEPRVTSKTWLPGDAASDRSGGPHPAAQCSGGGLGWYGLQGAWRATHVRCMNSSNGANCARRLATILPTARALPPARRSQGSPPSAGPGGQPAAVGRLVA